ncbi:MAG TPA: hypothetical protein ENK05_12635 [Gammaproteobacteria bacterium]|nr:hypothetical protein [Gammaproteobacteria bacterium]
MIGKGFFSRPGRRWMLPAALLAALPATRAAEVRGTVVIDYQGLFAADGSTRARPVSLALVPAEGQPVSRRASRLQHIEIAGNRMHPAFVTVRKGDRVEFVNRDEVLHELFIISAGKQRATRIARASDRAASRARFRLDHSGTTHFFCRIHKKSYARVDVVDTPYLQTVNAGQPFRFTGLRPGRWKLRLASPAAELRWVDVTAVTSPPPLELRLVSHGGGRGASEFRPMSDVAQLYGQ